MARRFLGLGLALGAAMLLAPAIAHANGRLPASSAFAFDPSDPNTIYMRTTFGLLEAKDNGHSWDWICERSLGFNGPEDPSVGVFSNGTLCATEFEGLGITTDHGCTFGFVGGELKGLVFIDIAVRRSQTSAAVAITSGYANASDDAGNPLFSSQLFMSTDNGTTWAKKGQPFDPSLLLETVDWSEADPMRIYVSGVRGSGMDAKGAFFVSTDGGNTFTELAFPLNAPTERAPFIGALDPKNADIVYVRTSGSQVAPARLLVTKDAGKTWTPVLTLTGPMLGFALNEDGSTVFAGGPMDGLLSAKSSDYQFTKKSDIQVQCLAHRAGELWACSNEFNHGFTAGVSSDEGVTFEPRLHLDQVRGPLDCPASTPTNQLCNADWPMQEVNLGIMQAEAGVDDGGADAGATANDGPHAAGGCALDLASGPSFASAAIVSVLAMFGIARVRRRRGQQRK